MVYPPVPAATYRLQFSSRLGFRDARNLVPYLAALGVTDLYASPILAARRGSTHGYDVTDPTRLNPELGTPDDFLALCAALRRHGMGLLLDIVPNHMAACTENPWWRDILRRGPDSRFAPFFAIDWHPDRPGLDNKVLLPVLGRPLADVLADGELTLVRAGGRFLIRYGNRRLPLAPASCHHLRQDFPGPLAKPADAAEEEMAASPDVLFRLLAGQAYRLVFWPLGNALVNYRRFFDVSDLVALRVEDELVFQAVHAFIFRLIGDGLVQGLRIDHIDGLRDPQGYLERLAGQGLYLVVEKILTGDEKLPKWPVHGTTGYDFMNILNSLFSYKKGAAGLQDLYRAVGGGRGDFATVVYRQKKKVMTRLFAAEADSLARQLADLAADDPRGRDIAPAALAAALAEATAALPVYRTYLPRPGKQDRRYIAAALARSEARRPDLAGALRFLGLVLDGTPELPGLDFTRRWQQFTGPVMAKGCEDTALYLYNVLSSRNEVGGEPQGTGLTVGAFHRFNLERLARWPHTMNATSTHDTKRSEDVRARINVLSEIPARWAGRVHAWRRWNRPCKPRVQGRPVPEGNLEYLLYQTMIGAWPLDREEIPQFRERLCAYAVKAAREAKVRTDWLAPDRAYEEALQEFTAAILTPGEHNPFLADFTAFAGITAQYGYIGSLAQVLLKAASPGVPDFYQGMELWRFNLVDPDSRRPVDFALRARLLVDLRAAADPLALARELVTSWPDGRIKLYVTYQTLNFRRSHRELFAGGAYQPVPAVGAWREHVCAFARRRREEFVLVAVPRHLARLHRDSPPGPAFRPADPAWEETGLLLSKDHPGRFRNVFTGEVLTAAGGTLPLTRVLADFPVALLAGI